MKRGLLRWIIGFGCLCSLLAGQFQVNSACMVTGLINTSTPSQNLSLETTLLFNGKIQHRQVNTTTIVFVFPCPLVDTPVTLEISGKDKREPFFSNTLKLGK